MSSEEDDSFAETYRSYKISTDYFLDWLWSQHEGLIPKPAKVPRTTKGMLTAAKALAQTLKKNKHSVPASIINSLRNAILKRREALAIYEELGADDVNHGVFIQRLEQTLSILTPFMATSLAPAAVAIDTDKGYNTNAFASLATLADDLDSDSLDPTSTISKRAFLPPQGLYAVVAPFESMLEDDELSELAEVIAIVQHLEKFKSQPKLAAGFGISDMSGAIHFCVISNAINNHHSMSKLSEDLANKLKVKLGMDHELMSHDPSLLLPLRDPPTEMLKPDRDAEPLRIWAVVEIFKNIKRDVIQGRAISGLKSWDQVLDCPSELILPLALENISDPHNSASLELALGMDIFLSSYEAFLWADGKQNKQNCRLQSLLLAKDMQKSILSSIGSLEKLAFDLSYYSMPIVFQKELYDQLDAYLREKAFDLYHQAPWTAGGHMLEMLYKAGSAGAALCFATEFVPSTLHLYNALTRSAFGMKKIQLMEDLCDLTVNTVFLGSRPTHNYVSHYRRAVWGTKRSNKGVPGDAHNAGSQFHRELIQTVRVGQLETVFRHQIANDYVMHPEYLAMVFGESPDLARTEPVRSRIRGMAGKSNVFDIMDKSKKLVLPEFRGRLPTARLDMFKVFTTCVAVLERFSIIVQGQHNGGGVEFHLVADNHIVKGSGLVDVVLGFILQFSGDKHKEKILQNLSLPTAAAWAFFIEVDQGAKLEDYLWNI
ncbi:hypothetical protein COL154_003093 [Colletotrichum chrysophilum]|uniref:uncharacterized protein n=1 Tax=Colletotrichum chrysophilum TaxID=1836956 RepID=UPI0023006476|nr:uncharacterized protein COL26b_013789 [Colletotrichum chrysophilum]KAJ0361253.1 hypothetical protein COL26b_013789 [Colletotrichum chrysophilum]KAJ0367445.1 hypothetical protein COL154_003093 [Colletotrichum chrysophilum]